MTPTDSSSLASFLDQHGITRHKIGVFDIDGVLRGKYVNRPKFLSAAEKGLEFAVHVDDGEEASTGARK